MFTSCLEKQKALASLFAPCKTKEEKYQKLMVLGRELPPLKEKSEETYVPGCQSEMHLDCELKEGFLFFKAASDALISAGLAACLIMIYNGESPEVVLKCPPDVLETLELSQSLSPNRANGLYSIHLKMKQQALQMLVTNSNFSL